MLSRVRPLRRLALSGLAILAASLTAWTYSTVGSSAQISFDDLDDPPVLSLPDDVTVISADLAGAPVTYRATAEDDNGNNLNVTCSHPSGSVFPLNMTTVTCAATDRRGQTTTGTFTITVLTVGPISKTRVIDFERFPGPDGVLNTADDVCAQDREVLNAQYEKLGVSSFVLSNDEHPTIYRHDDPYIEGSPATLHPVSLTDRTDHQGDQRFLRDFFVHFSLDVFRVKISGLNADEPMTLEAFNDKDELIASARRGAGSDRSVLPIEVRVDGKRGFIRKVRLNLRQGTERCCDGGPEYYDMLEFDPAAQLPVPSNTTRIDFENYPGADGALGTADDTPTQEMDELFTTPVDTVIHKYDAVGARFGLLDGRFFTPPSPTVRESAFVYVPGSPRALDPRSKVEREAGCGERCLKDFEITFPNPVTRVKLAALNADEVVRLRAYNAAGGAPIATASRGRGGDRAVHFIEVRVDPCQPLADLIHRVVVDLEESGDPIGPELYDLLEFDPVVTNRAPVASTPPVITFEDQSVDFTLGAGDQDAGDALTFTVLSQPSHGTLSGDGADLTYTPDPHYHGPDGFTYKASDGEADSNIATVQITVTPVNDAPAASPDGYGVAEDGTLTVAAEDGVLDNDTDVEQATLTARLLGQPSHGSLTFNPDGSFTYTPQPDYYGPDSFTYEAADATADSDPATVTLAVSEVNDAPSAARDSRGTDEDTPLTFAADTLLKNDTAGPANEGAQTLTVTGVSDKGDTHGTVTLDAGAVTYSPALNYHGPASFEYTVCDNGTTAGRPAPECTTGVVTISVAPVNDAPTADSRTFGTDEDTQATFTLITAPTDVDGDSVELESVTQPSHGSVSITGKTTVSYTPALNYHGPDSFTYTVTDKKGATATAAVLVTVSPVNDPPVFVPLGPLAVNAGSPLTFTPEATDPDAGDVLTFTSPNLPPGATLTPQGGFTWTACYRLTSVNITFVVTDLAGASDTMNVSVTVVGALAQLNQLSAYFDSLGLPNRTYEPLDADLDFAIKQYDEDDTSQTCDGLQKFINGVRQRANNIPPDAAARLINAAQALQSALGCGGGPGSGCQ